MNPKVDAYLKRATQWQKELALLRGLILACGLDEELKWGKPCYSLEGGNVLILIPMKEHCALMFCKGALLKDSKKLLAKPGENTQAGRWIKFAHACEITSRAAVIKSYIREAIAAQKAGLEVKYKTTADYKVPDELKKKLGTDMAFKKAFAALTPGRQRGYLIYFAAPKQAQTRAARIEKCAPRIFQGKGWNEAG